MSDVCPVCHKINYVCKKKFNNLDLGYCNNCSVAYAQPLIRGGDNDVGESNSTITEAEFYEGLKQNHQIQSEIAKSKAPKMLKYWEKILGENTGRESRLSILEIGCGTGQYYEAWKELNVKWTGLEVNKDMLDFCYQRNIPVSNTNIMNTKLDEKYDIVFLSQVLEHIIDPNLFIQKIRDNMNDGGILHIDVPNHDSLSSLYRKLNPFHPQYGFLQPYHHLIAYTKQSLSYLLEQNNFTIKQVKAYPNNDKTFGQLLVDNSIKNKILFLISRVLGRGSLLVGIAIKK